MWPFKKKQQIYFETDNWAVRKYAPIKSAGEFIPEKFKNMSAFANKQNHHIDSLKTVKACPGISEYMQLGYVIPAWCDIELFPMDDGSVRARYSDPNYNHAFHFPQQLGSLKDDKFHVRTPVKLDNPWWTYTEPGWSLLYLPMFYHEEKNWEAVPGIIDHDIGALRSPINIMLKNREYTLIKQGEPICQAIPIFREDVVARTGDLRQSTISRHNKISTLFNMTFKGWTKYMREHKRYKLDAQDTEL